MTKKSITLIALTVIAVIAVIARDPIPQDPRYHDFADQRTILSVPNAVNVLSNIPFIIAGAWGAALVLRMTRRHGINSLLTQYSLFFAGVAFSGLGSSWYHLAPSNASLAWDRLPISIAFMALLSSVISESVDRKPGRILLAPLLATGAFSVAYWAWTESIGSGDLRLYALVQFLPVVLIPLVLLLYRPPKNYAVSIWLLAGLYALSKLFEIFDREVFALTGIVSGHTIKHVLAAAGVLFVVRMVHGRRQELAGG
jgi:hypothetical protein